MAETDLDDMITQLLKRAWEYELPSPPDFDEAAYLAAYPDVAKALKNGKIKSAFAHFVLVGRREGRTRPDRNIE